MAKLLDLSVYGPGHISNILQVDASVYAKAFITDGGKNTQVVRGDGTLASISSLSVGNADTVDNKHASDFATSGHIHTSVNDISSGAATTFAYSKSGLGYDSYTWIAAWNGYELRAVSKTQFSISGHTHDYITSLGNKNAEDLPSTYPKGLSTNGIYHGGYPFNYGCGITAVDTHEGAFQIAGQWNEAVSSPTDNDKSTEMYIRGRRDNFDVWTTWTRVITNRNYTSFVNTTNFPGLNKVGTVTSVTVTGANGLSGTGTITSSGTITLSNSGVRSVSINGNYLRVNTNGTNADLTIPYAVNADKLDNYHESDFFRYRGALYQKHSYDANTLGIGEYTFRSTAYGNVGTGANHANALSENSTIQVFKWLQMSAVAWSDSMSYRLNWTGETNTQRPDGWSPWITFVSSSNYTDYVNTTNFPGLNKVGTVTSVTVTGTNGLSGSGTITTSGTITLSNAGVRSTTINGNYLRVNTNGTIADLTIPYATYADTLDGYHYNSFAWAVHSHEEITNSGSFAAIDGTTLGNTNTLRINQVYNNGYPVNYGNLLRIGGVGYGELLCEWTGTASGTLGRLYYRSKRDVNDTPWSAWGTVAYTSDIPIVTNYYWANISVSSSSSETTAPTFATIKTENVLPKADETYGIGANGTEYATGDIRVVYTRHLESARSYSNDKNLYIQYLQKGNTLMQLNGGNVGIGTESPSYKLDVNGIIRANGNILLEAANTITGGGIAFWNGSVYVNGTINSAILALNANGGTGNVGIGTYDPKAKLHVLGHARIVKRLTIGEDLGNWDPARAEVEQISPSGQATDYWMGSGQRDWSISARASGESNSLKFFAHTSGGSTPNILTLEKNGKVTINGDLYIAGNCVPNANNSYTSGTSTNRWSNVYSVLGNFSGAVSFANGTWNPVGDDSAIGDCNLAGLLGLKSLNNNLPGIAFYNSSGTNIGKLLSNASVLKWNNNTVWHAGNDGTGSGLDADLLDGLHQSSFTREYSFSMSDYGKYVIGLIKLDSCEDSRKAFGRIHLARTNTLYGTAYIDYNVGTAYSTLYMRGTIICHGRQYSPCTFTYNGVVYGGLILFHSDAQEIAFVQKYNSYGIDPFVVCYYDTRNGIKNTEIYNSLSTTNRLEINTTIYGYLSGNISGSASSIRDTGNGTAITCSYSTGGFSTNPSWVAAWNGYNLTYVSPSVLNVKYASGAGNADTVDNLHAADFVRAYTTYGTSYSIDSDWGQSIVTFDPVCGGTYPRSTPNATILNMGNSYARRKQLFFDYNTNYIYFRRRVDSSWSAWVRIALASDIPTIPTSLPANGGNADTVDNKHAADFATAGHTHSLGNKAASDLSSTYPEGISVGGIYNNGYPFTYGSTITACGNGGYFQIAGQWNSSVTGSSNYDFPTEMYIRGRRDSYDVWTTWSRVLTNRNYSSFALPITGGTCTGNIYAPAFYESSDERLKDFENDIDADFNTIRAIPKKYFRWKERPNDLQIGTSAQVVQHFYPEIVTSNGDGFLNIDYSKLSIVALSAIDKLHLENQDLKHEINLLKQEIQALKKDR